MPVPAGIKKTNTVSFGKFAICLEKCQLNYYTDGEMMKVIDVRPDFDFTDLYELAERISEKNGYGAVTFTSKDSVIKTYYNKRR